LRSFAGTLKEMHATCLKQQIVGEDIVILDGEVELFVEKKFHIWADKITIDKRKKTLVA
jgi:lipopolysaccharide assembly outer membrane protein LptD (OstA)